ncbi:hypothetical protein OUZ56_016482 [Daphnia magna]|uniref:Uncharacterized protein n=1 Tax=Daphnia magna TaxID=35525 RepID=A0ABR0AQP6_9CRUS|nr:hypothetical protein OUZ56_016482 [Daphnia magna]
MNYDLDSREGASKKDAVTLSKVTIAFPWLACSYIKVAKCPDRNCCPIVAPKPYQWHRCDEFIQYMFQSNPLKKKYFRFPAMFRLSPSMSLARPISFLLALYQHLWGNLLTPFYDRCLATFTLVLDMDCSVRVLPRVRKLEKTNQREMLDMLTLLLKDSAPSQPNLSSITELFQLPMKDLDDAKNFEKLLTVQNNQSKMRAFVIGIGGTTNTIVGRVMKSIMTYECGSCFCYVGLNEDKVAFKTFTICDIRECRKFINICNGNIENE